MSAVYGEEGGTLAETAHLCRSLLVEIIALPHLPDLGTSFSDALKDNLMRFKIWADNLDAFGIGQTSLEWRLREHPRMSNDVIRVLRGLIDCLEVLRNIASGERVGERLDSLHDLLSTIEDVAVEDDSLDLDLDFDLPTNEVDAMLAEASESITRLIRYSIIIRKMAAQDPFKKALSKSAPWPDTYDTQHLLHTIPKLVNCHWLAVRLGQAMTQRRQYFAYRQSHQEAIVASANDDVQSRFTKATTMIPLPTQGLSQLILEEELASLDGDNATETSYAATEYTSLDDDKMHVPACPKPDASGYFECPFCRHIVRAQHRAAWKRHVFHDLRPYVCTFPSCSSGLFDSRHKWFDHEMLEHRLTRSCCMCDQQCKSTREMTAHLEGVHRFNSTQVPIVLSSCNLSSVNVQELSCPFCDEKSFMSAAQANFKPFRRHLARHLEEMALFALPRLTRDDGDTPMDDDDSEDDDSEAIDEQSDFDDTELETLEGKAHIQLMHDAEFVDNSVTEVLQPEKKHRLDSPDTPDQERESRRGRRSLSHTDTVPIFSGNDLYNIACVCGFSHDDGNTVICKGCDTWQHVSCYYFPDYNILEPHRCNDCLPRPIDSENAHIRQRRWIISSSDPTFESPDPSTTSALLVAEAEEAGFGVPGYRLSLQQRYGSAQEGEAPQSHLDSPKIKCTEPGCPFSDRVFSTFDNLQRHRRERHSRSPTRHTCPKGCGKTFTRSTGRDNHVKHNRCKPTRAISPPDTDVSYSNIHGASLPGRPNDSSEHTSQAVVPAVSTSYAPAAFSVNFDNSMIKGSYGTLDCGPFTPDRAKK